MRKELILCDVCKKDISDRDDAEETILMESFTGHYVDARLHYNGDLCDECEDGLIIAIAKHVQAQRKKVQRRKGKG